MWIRSSRNETGIGVSVFARIQCVSEFNVIVACSGCRTRTPAFVSVRSTTVGRHKRPSERDDTASEHYLHRSLVSVVRECARVLCRHRNNRHRDAIPNSPRHFRLFSSHERAHSVSSGHTTYTTSSHTFHFSQLQRVSNIQDQHIFRTFWLTKIKKTRCNFLSHFVYSFSIN